MRLWDKIRRFLLFWLIVFIALVLIAIVVYWEALSGAVIQHIYSAISTFVIIIILLLCFRFIF